MAMWEKMAKPVMATMSSKEAEMTMVDGIPGCLGAGKGPGWQHVAGHTILNPTLNVHTADPWDSQPP